jgi:signal transduction histidine kinase
MSAPNFAATVDHFASRLAANHAALAARWLERLDALLDVDRRDVFPTHQLLDHIPDLLREIAVYMRAPADGEIAANTAVMAKASELGLLRFDQQASVHQVLREYQIFSEILEDFFAREAAQLGPRADATAAVLVVARAQQAVRVLQQKTVDAFIGRYTEAIEHQQARLRQFSLVIGHEIRQPLGVLQVVAKALPDGDDADTQRLTQALGRNVERLTAVAGMLERLARLTHGGTGAPNEQTVDLTAVAHDVARQLADMAVARGVTFEIAESLPSVRADAGRVELVLMNLMANAIKYSDPDKPARVVSVTADPTAGRPTVRVSDNGLGIPRGKLDVIFDQFVRVHAHLDDELGTQGMGLGLSIVRESLHAMEATVTVESREGHGTTFILAWPATRSPQQALAGSATRPTTT